MEVLELPNKSEKIIDFAWEPKVGFRCASSDPNPNLDPEPDPERANRFNINPCLNPRPNLNPTSICFRRADSRRCAPLGSVC